jgi:hypothetical protein
LRMKLKLQIVARHKLGSFECNFFEDTCKISAALCQHSKTETPSGRIGSQSGVSVPYAI